MAKEFSQLELLHELEPVVEENLNRHFTMAKTWHPHDYVPWSDGKNFAAMGGVDYDPEQSQLSETAKAAMITNLLTEDNLPSYHREISMNFTMDGPWGTWVNRWTAEENRHGIVMRDYLVVTRGVDPVALEQARLAHMTNGFHPGQGGQGDVLAETIFDSVSYVTFQELATRVSHRNTGRACGDPIADSMLARIAADENLHMIFYRNLMEAGLEIAPDQAIRSIYNILTNFQMPGVGMHNFRRNAMLIAKSGIYDLRQHMDEVVMPVLRKWRIFERNDFGGEGEHFREKLDTFMQELAAATTKFEESRARLLAREAAKAEKAAAS